MQNDDNDADIAAAAIRDIREFVDAAKRRAHSSAVRHTLLNPHHRHGGDAFLSQRRRQTFTTFGTAAAHGSSTFTEHEQFAAPVQPHQRLYPEDATIERVAVHSRPWKYIADPVARSVHTPSSLAEMHARSVARIRLLQLLGPEMGHTPSTVGNAHLPRPLRLHRAAQADQRSRLGPGSYHVSAAAQRWCTPSHRARSGLGVVRWAPPRPAAAKPSPPAAPLHVASQATVETPEQQQDDDPLDASSHGSCSTDADETFLTEVSWMSLAAMNETAVASLVNDSDDDDHAVEVGPPVPAHDVSAMVRGLKRIAAARAEQRLSTLAYRSHVRALDVTQHRSVRNVIIAPPHMTASRAPRVQRNRALRQRVDAHRRAWERHRRGLPDALNRTFEALSRAHGALALLLAASEDWDAPIPHPKQHKGKDVDKDSGSVVVLDSRVPSGRWTTSWSRQLAAEEHARAARETALPDHRDTEADVRTAASRTAHARVRKLLRHYAADIGLQNHVAAALQPHVVRRRAQSAVDMSRGSERFADAADQHGTDAVGPDININAADSYHPPSGWTTHARVNYSRMSGRTSASGVDDEDDEASRLMLAVPRGRADARSVPAFSFPRSERGDSKLDDEDHGDVRPVQLADAFAPALADPVILRHRRPASAPHFAMQLGRDDAPVEAHARAAAQARLHDDIFHGALVQLVQPDSEAAPLPRARRLHVDFDRQIGREDLQPSAVDAADDHAMRADMPPEHCATPTRPRTAVVPDTQMEATSPLPSAWVRAAARDHADAHRAHPARRWVLAGEFDLGI